MYGAPALPPEPPDTPVPMLMLILMLSLNDIFCCYVDVFLDFRGFAGHTLFMETAELLLLLL